ncbi:hypothetical protein TNCV_1387431 [Trichonephila clavipes]|nr:hypothetical protein TNCV_1387431 [Trichonephila clavipes]
MENKPMPEEAATSNDQVQNTKSPPVPPSKRPTEEFITDNAAAISELLKLRAAYAADARKIAIIPSTQKSSYRIILSTIRTQITCQGKPAERRLLTATFKA